MADSSPYHTAFLPSHYSHSPIDCTHGCRLYAGRLRHPDFSLPILTHALTYTQIQSVVWPDMEDILFSWGAVYVALFLPAVLMLCNFVFGNCFLSAELARSQQSTGPSRTRARILGRSCIALVLVSFVWQYGAFMFASRGGRSRQCNLGFFIWDVVDAMPSMCSVDSSHVRVCTTMEVVYQVTFLAFLTLYVMSVFSTPQVSTTPASTAGRETERDEACCSYCSKCQATVLGMDHHCYLIGNCVGQSNRRLFVACLTSGVVNLTVLLWCRSRWALTEGGPITVFGLVVAVCFVTFLVCLLTWQVLLMSCGYTTLRFLKTARERRCSKLSMLCSLFTAQGRAKKNLARGE